MSGPATVRLRDGEEGRAPNVREVPQVKYSVCITDYNNERTVRESMDSVVCQMDQGFEVVVVDSLSTDGTREVLHEYERRGQITVIETKCSRGRGRQLAFLHSRGEYVISNVDLDCMYKPKFAELLRSYHGACEGMLLLALSGSVKNAWGPSGVILAPRSLIERLGGWRDLQAFEDADLCVRAARAGVYRWGWFDILQEANDRRDWGRREKLRNSYGQFRDWLRLGGRVGLIRWTKRFWPRDPAFNVFLGDNPQPAGN